MAIALNAIEPEEIFYTPAAVGKRLGLNPTTVIKYFHTRPGVVRLGTEGTHYRRRRLILRISESAVKSFLRERMVSA
jgi:hypothetical protein